MSTSTISARRIAKALRKIEHGGPATRAGRTPVVGAATDEGRPPCSSPLDEMFDLAVELGW